MTEITKNTDETKMPAAVERFVLQWGEMASRWGVNRSVGQIHAWLYLAEKPMTAEEIATALNMARSNVSTSLKELMSWNLISRVHIMGDRRDYFAAETDLWEMLMRITAGRKEREIDPALEVLRSCASEANGDPQIPAKAAKRLKEMEDFLEALTLWYEQMIKLPNWKLRALMKMGNAISKLIGDKKAPKKKA